MESAFGSLFDATQTKVQNVGDTQLVKTVSWYDNEMSYVSQLVRTVNYFAKIDKVNKFNNSCMSLIALLLAYY